MIRVGCLIRLEGLRASTMPGGRHRIERAQPSPSSRTDRQAGRCGQNPQGPDAEESIAFLDS